MTIDMVFLHLEIDLSFLFCPKFFSDDLAKLFFLEVKDSGYEVAAMRGSSTCGL